MIRPRITTDSKFPLRDINTQVASTSEEQAAASVQINDSIQRVSIGQQEVVSQAARARELAVELKAVVGEVDELIRGFRTAEGSIPLVPGLAGKCLATSVAFREILHERPVELWPIDAIVIGDFTFRSLSISL